MRRSASRTRLGTTSGTRRMCRWVSLPVRTCTVIVTRQQALRRICATANAHSRRRRAFLVLSSVARAMVCGRVMTQTQTASPQSANRLCHLGEGEALWTQVRAAALADSCARVKRKAIRGSESAVLAVLWDSSEARPGASSSVLAKPEERAGLRTASARGSRASPSSECFSCPRLIWIFRCRAVLRAR